jgi:peptide/nickel transport system permease protein
VTSDLVKKFPATLSIAIGASIIFLPLGVFLGVLAARHRGTGIDRGLVGGSLVLYSIPVFVIALVAWVLFSLTWQIFPDTSYVPITQNPAKWFWHLLLPWLVLALTSTTAYTRYTRGSMLETMGEDYVRTATAKGLRSQTVMRRHALRAAIVPVITIFGLDFASLLTGTLTIEYIFNIDGIGRWGIEALRTPIDFPVVQATVLVAAFIIVMANLIVDLVYSVIDPRVRLV